MLHQSELSILLQIENNSRGVFTWCLHSKIASTKRLHTNHVSAVVFQDSEGIVSPAAKAAILLAVFERVKTDTSPSTSPCFAHTLPHDAADKDEKNPFLHPLGT